MIPTAHITAWRAQAPWPADTQIEQDLILSRALVEIFSEPSAGGLLAFRGGTALHKLILPSAGRYSEDIDLVQIQPGPIGSALDAIRSKLDSWLGKPNWKLNQGRATLVYRFESTALPVQSLRLKVEINTREHFSVLGHRQHEFTVNGPWFAGNARITTYRIEELLGTKLRALYQRKKGRDLYDLWLVLSNHELDEMKIVECFNRYVGHEGITVSRAEFEANLAGKLESPAFRHDILPLLAADGQFDPDRAAEVVGERIIGRFPGKRWKGKPAETGVSSH